ncbi:MAG: hypothetical protein A2408_03585 [Candidatus Yonathbacteria bacterium RIFOXYC1_FULL_52_10]|uniref:GGDEF domain-containing protein n=1 Tax=Candidatus Yonathbacteria bacterium RIFOXYD1_FULL_52_36 TaxID=1802730 RepID=A0A1G2SJ09_9BACT|nr:MAG: hypothetical protein A2408_03585 [Candidatus Yonathbacteria bacterium RIFOXYC1_FULL_52_10]OHA85010.1 MAG: hypothetical protein A2591_02205 [Candidatus Yonathbacteria bacterium RIFOXYD1_FULL_52_36]
MGNRCSDCPEYQHLLGENAELRIQLEKEREKNLWDPLTGVMSRFAFEERVEQLIKEITASTGSVGELSLCFIDMNGLKRLNDSYGHGAGDSAIIFLSKVISENAGEGAIVGRMGGESDEFGVALPNISLVRARECVEKIKNALRYRRLKLACGDSVFVRASYGVSNTLEGLFTGSDLFATADERMRKHKRKTRGGRRS